MPSAVDMPPVCDVPRCPPVAGDGKRQPAAGGEGEARRADAAWGRRRPVLRRLRGPAPDFHELPPQVRAREAQ
jgi:hypothetical protein